MLTPLETPQGRRAQRPQSLKQEYEEFILQRIEEFKDQIPRNQLLSIADEAVQELESGSDDQLLLTEVLVLEQVDRLIMRRLRLPTYRRWRERHLRLRRAQQQPSHWGLDADTPLPRFAATMSDETTALVVGAAAAPAAFYLASHGVDVLVIDPELAAVEGTESRAASEALASRIQVLVVHLGTWIPDVAPQLSVVDPSTVWELEGSRRVAVIDELKRRTPSGGSHLVLSVGEINGAPTLAPEAMQTYYSDWRLERPRRRSRPRWFLATKS